MMDEQPRHTVLLVQVIWDGDIWRVTVLDNTGMTVAVAQSKAEARAIVDEVLAD